MNKAPSTRVNFLVGSGGASNTEIQGEITKACTEYGANFLALLRDGHWTLQHAHDVLLNTWHIDNLDLMEMAGLAWAVQVYQSTAAE
jgi:hypothetical protein